MEKAEIISKARDAFLGTTLRDPSTARTGQKVLTELDLFLQTASKSNVIATEILRHYGDFDHEIISEIDAVRTRSETLLKYLPMVESNFDEGVMDQWADFLAHYYYAVVRCRYSARSVLKENYHAR